MLDVETLTSRHNHFARLNRLVTFSAWQLGLAFQRREVIVTVWFSFVGIVGPIVKWEFTLLVIGG